MLPHEARNLLNHRWGKFMAHTLFDDNFLHSVLADVEVLDESFPSRPRDCLVVFASKDQYLLS